MLELSGTHFERGVFELRFDKPLPAAIRRWASWGPVRGRLIAMSVFLVAGLLLYFRVPALVLLRFNVVDMPMTALRIQTALIWTLVGLGILLYLGVLMMQNPSVVAVFDRTQSQYRWRITPLWKLVPIKSSVAPLTAIQTLEVYGPEKDPKTPHGYIEIRAPELDEPSLKVLRFSFLSDEQFRFYPLNLSRMLQRRPQGDWVDPDDEPLQSR